MLSYPILPSQKATLSIIPYYFTIYLTSQLLFSYSPLKKNFYFPILLIKIIIYTIKYIFSFFFFFQFSHPHNKMYLHNSSIPLGSVWEFIRKWNEIEWNDNKGMERNGMYLSKGKEWNEMELSNLDWMF